MARAPHHSSTAPDGRQSLRGSHCRARSLLSRNVGEILMIDREVELLAVGAGPSNLALAVALEELAPDLAANSLIIESAAAVERQPGLLLHMAERQASFLHDLPTQPNPQT